MLLLMAMLAGCGDCHPQIAAKWAASPMGQSSGIVEAASEPTGEFLQESSGTRFGIHLVAGRLELTWLRSHGEERHRQSLDFFVGSRRAGRSYGFAENGYLYQAPVGYYTRRGAWDMAPGYEHDAAPDLNRPVTAECLFCHASGMNAVGGALNRFADLSGLRGVACERCHGDGARHAAQPRADNIVNPARLGGSRRDSICEQCHLSGEARLELPRKRIADFRPGDDLSDFIAVFVAEPAGGVRVNSHAEALARSRCKQASGERLWCGTCHDPHGTAISYDAVCSTCHDQQQCPVAAKKGGDCIGCHMPKARAADGGHTVFTDHSIPRKPRPTAGNGKLLALQPYFAKQSPESSRMRNLGLAYADAGRRLNRADWLAKSWPLLRQAAVDAPPEPALYTAIATLLDATGEMETAIHYYRLSLQMDSAQFEPLMNLARLLERRGEKQEARALREQAAQMCPRCVGGLNSR